jgi:membrane protein implicated in regulation of membrane protease activity
VVERGRDRCVAAIDVEGRSRAAGLIEDRRDHGGDVGTSDLTAVRLAVQTDGSRRPLIGEAPGAEDRPLTVALRHRRIGLRLGTEIDAEPILVLGLRGRVLGPHGADDDKPGDVCCLRRAEQLDGAIAIHRELSLGPASGSGPRRKHSGIGSGQRLRDRRVVAVLEVAHDWVATIGADVDFVLGIANETDDGVTVIGEQADEEPTDLSVGSSDHDAHLPRLPSSRPRSGRTIGYMTALSVALLVTGVILIVLEAHVPSLGVLGVPGVVSLAAGAVLGVSALGGSIVFGIVLALALVGISGSVVALTLRQGLAVRRRRVSAGAEGLIGHLGVVRSWDEQSGKVLVDGGLWSARRSALLDDDDDQLELHAGDQIVVERLNGLTLGVRPAEEWELHQ